MGVEEGGYQDRERFLHSQLTDPADKLRLVLFNYMQTDAAEKKKGMAYTYIFPFNRNTAFKVVKANL